MKYQTKDGIECTEEENKLIDSLKRLAKRWKKEGKDLMLFSWSGSLCVVKKSCIDMDVFSRGIVEYIVGITNDGGDPDDKFYEI